MRLRGLEECETIFYAFNWETNHSLSSVKVGSSVFFLELVKRGGP